MGGSGAAFSPLSLAPHSFRLARHVFAEEDGTGAVAPDGAVGYVTDLTGNGHPYLQATSSARPLLKTAGGLYWLEADGVDEFMAATWTALTKPWTRVSAWRFLSTVDSNEQILGGVTGADSALFRLNGNLGIFDGNVISAGAVANDVDIVVTEVHNGASSALSIDSNAPATGNAGATDNVGVTLFSNPSNFFSNARYVGDVIVERALTADEKAACITYFAGLQGRPL